MNFVKIAEELPSLVAELIFNHIRNGAGSKTMTVTGKLHIDLVQVILEVSLNHSLQVATAQDIGAVDEIAQNEVDETALSAIDKAIPSAIEKDETGSLLEGIPEPVDHEHDEGDVIDSTAPQEGDAVDATIPLEHDSSKESESSDVPKSPGGIQIEPPDLVTQESDKNVTAKLVSEEINASENAEFNAGPSCSKDIAPVIVKNIKSVSDEAKNAKEDSPPKKIGVRSVTKSARESKLRAPVDKIPMKAIKPSPVKRTADASLAVTPDSKVPRTAQTETTVLANTTRSGRKIVKPKRIWNPDMAAEVIPLTPRPTTSKESASAGADSNEDIEKVIKAEIVDESDEDVDWALGKDSGDDIDVSGDGRENSKEMSGSNVKRKRVPYNCCLCDATFPSFWKLKRHCSAVHQTDISQQNENNDKNVCFPCKVCDKVFSKKGSLNEHMFVHDKNTKYKCEECQKTFATQGKLTKHNKTWHSGGGDSENTGQGHDASRLEPKSHALIKDAKCQSCKRVLETYLCMPQDLVCPTCKLDVVDPPLEGAVVIPATDEQDITFQCSFCEDTEFIGSEDVLRNHLYECHSELLNHTCPFCEIKFVHIETLNLHLLQQHPNRAYKKKTSTDASNEGDHQDTVIAKWRKMYYCGPCEKIYHTRMRLHDHIIVVHENKELPYECTICSKRFLHKDVLMQHSRFTHANEWFRVCDQCGKFFRKKVEFEHHRHADDPWKCEECGKTFTSYSGFRMHMKRHRELPSLMCKYCGEMFHYQSFLTIHERKHTGDKPYECQHCNRKFSNMYVYNKHQKRHFDKKIKCEQCPQTFLYPSDLRAHEKTHSTDRLRYACSFCDCSYLKMSSLRSHMKSKHGLDMVEMSMEQMEVDLEDKAQDGITLYSCVTCSSCYYTEEECVKCQMSHEPCESDSQVAVTIVTQ